MKTYDFMMRLLGDSASLRAATQQGASGIHWFAQAAKNDIDRIKQHFNGLKSQMAALGVGFAGYKTLAGAAELEHRLTRIGQTAGVSRAEAQALGKTLFGMAEQTGVSVELLTNGFDKLVQSGQSFNEAKATIQAINVATAVTGANADTLANAMTTASAAFHFDLSNPQTAQSILDKMTVAGRQGNAELESLSDIVARIGVNAKTSGMGFDQMLAFTEGLSQLEKNPERLATMADSTLRIFTNQRYSKRLEKNGIKMFNTDGSRRDAFAVFKDIKTKYDSFKTESEKAAYFGKLLKGADLDTVRGLRTLMQDGMLQMLDKYTKTISGASGALKDGIADATNDAYSQAQRLKTVMTAVGYEFAAPVNSALTKLAKWSMDKSDKLDSKYNINKGSQVIGGVAMMAGTYMLGSFLKGKIGRFIQGKASVAAGVGEGKALEAAAGVTPVYVTNYAEIGNAAGSAGAAGATIPGLPGVATKLPPSLMRLIANPYTIGAAILATEGVIMYRGIQQAQKQRDDMAALLSDQETGWRSAMYRNAMREMDIKAPGSAAKINEWSPATTWARVTGDTKNPLAAPSFKNETSVNVYIDGQKTEPNKTVTQSKQTALRGQH
jgi:TP901 family phage tail tape measure protein